MPPGPPLDDILAGLDPEQRAVVEAPPGPVCVLAGAGTGKTRALTHRIAYRAHAGTLDPARVLALTFTARAAGELRTRLRVLGVPAVQARTFHAAALRQLQYFWPQVVGGEPPQVLPAKAALIAEAASRCRLKVDRAVLRDLAAEVEWAKVSQVSPPDYPACAAAVLRLAPGDLDLDAVARVYAAYEELKREAGRADFEDVLLLTAGMLDDDRRMAVSVREQYRHFLVDEYQDVSPVQQRLLDLWLGDRDDLTVVGDAAQTIYSFSGATPRFLLGFGDRHPGAAVVKLVRDYRSTPQVVHLANRLLAGASGDAARLRLELVAQRPDGPPPVFRGAADEPGEADGVAREIQTLIAAGVSPREIAVLYRINAQSETFEEALTRAGVPYVVRGGERFFQRKEVRDAVMLLRGAARAGEGGAGLAADTGAVLGSLGYRDEAPAGPGASRERWESLSALVTLAEEVAAERPGATLADLVAELEERAAAQHAPSIDGVTLASLHAAKGLEWDAVFLVGLVDGTVPITYARTPEQVEEERRLLYVGVTRARSHLSLTWAAARNPGGRASRQPSRFLDGLGPDRPGRAARSPRGQRAGRRTAVCRQCGAALTTPWQRKVRRCESCHVEVDGELFERLRQWRLAVSQQASVPAFVVFTDATLTAIAQDQPTSLEDLAAIPGVGKRKLELYAESVLALVTGDPPPDPAPERLADTRDR